MKKSKRSKKLKKEQKQKPGIDLSDRMLIIAIIIIIALFAFFFVGYKLISRGPAVKTIQQLHEENLEGKLSPDEGYVYNGFSFVYAQDMWFTQVQRKGTNELYNVPFRFGPRELEDLPVAGNISDFKDFNGTYITFDPAAGNFNYTAVAAAELSLKLSQALNMIPIAACTKNETKACYTRPIVNCSNSINPVIYLEKSDNPAIVRENEACIRIMGDKMDIVKSTDRLLYVWFGIMD